MNKIQSTEGLTEKQIAKREYSRAYYAAHKDKMIAAVRASQAKHTKATKKRVKKETTAMHAICPAKVADKALAKLQKGLQKAERKVADIRTKLDTAKLLVQMAKDAIKARKAEIKAAKADAK